MSNFPTVMALCHFVTAISRLVLPSTVVARRQLLHVQFMDRLFCRLQIFGILSADSDAKDSSKALSNVSSGSASSLHWIFGSSIPHTIQSRSILFSDLPKLQCSERWWSSATYVEIDSLARRFLVLKQYLWTITDGFMSWYLATRSIISWPWIQLAQSTSWGCQIADKSISCRAADTQEYCSELVCIFNFVSSQVLLKALVHFYSINALQWTSNLI